MTITCAASSRAPISRYARQPLVTVPASATLREAAVTMRREGVGAVAVERGSRLGGILTEWDIVSALAADGDPDLEAVVGDMIVSVVTAQPDDTVLDVTLMMLDAEIGHVILVDAAGHGCGMVSLRDLIRPLIMAGDAPALPAD